MKRYFIGFSLLVLILFGASFVRWPLKYVDYKNYAELIWFDGVKYKSHEDVAYLEKNTCSEDSRKDCVCVVMIHGLGDSAITWRKIFKAQESLVTPTQLIALDLPGAGASRFLDTTENYKVNFLAKKYNSLDKELCISDKIILLSNSLGGWIASWMQYLKPEQYMANILLNPAGLDRSYEKVVGNLIDPTPQKLMLSYRLSHNFGNNKKPLPWFVARHASARMRHFPVEKMIKAQSLEDLFVDSFMGKIRDKTYVIWGKDDGFLGDDHAKGYQKLLAKDHFSMIKNCAHVPQDQCPQTVLNRLNTVLNNKK